MVLASLGASGFAIVIGVYLLAIIVAYIASPRDVTGRRRANGCVVALTIFFGLFLIAFASWASDHIF